MANQADLASPPFRILFEDQQLLVLSKAPGLLSQGDISGVPSLVDLLKIHFGRNFVGLVHRLDRNTSGLMIIAKRSKSAERLTKQLQVGSLVRIYHALLLGTLTLKKTIHWEHWLLKNNSTNEVKVVAPQTLAAKNAKLLVTPLLNFSDPRTLTPITLASFELETGRSHQIRVQAKEAGYPLIGDTKYGNAKGMTLFHRPALHSCELRFLHPISGEKMSFVERYSSDMIASFPALSDY